jgi:REP-associated tyrosine transposase
MSRIPRCQLEDGTYHVTARGTGGLQIFLSDVDRYDFVDLLDSTIRRFHWSCSVYCLMGTHYHVVLQAARLDLSHGMRRLNGTYSKRFNRRHERRGHLFEGRFAAGVIRDDRHFEAACLYVLENPVRAGLCRAAKDWRWSGGVFA